MKRVSFVLLMALCWGPNVANSADLFFDKCGGKAVKAKTLTGACKDHPGKTIVKCKEKCTKRKKLKCVKRSWVLKSSKTCAVNNNSNSNQMKTRKCSASEIAQLKADYSSAKTRALRIRSGVQAELGKKHSKDVKKQLERVKRWVDSILNKLNKKVTFVCKGTKGLCSSANAHTVALVGHTVRVCDRLLTCSDAGYRAAVIVHELSHKAGANDAAYFSNCGSSASSSFPKSLKKWSKTADSYEYWARFGFCVPGKTCP